MPGHHTGPYLRVIPRRPPRTLTDVGAGHDHHHHHPHQDIGGCRRRGRPALHRRSGQAPQPGRRLHHHDRMEGARIHEGALRRPVARRHRRYVPAPSEEDRGARPTRIRAVQRRLPRHDERRSRGRGRPAIHRSQCTRLRHRRPRGGYRRPPGRRRRPDAAPQCGHGYRLPGRRPALRHRPLPRQRPRPLGCRAPGRRLGGDRRKGRSATAQRKAVRHSLRHRPDRPRLLAVARPAHPRRPDGVQLGQLTARPGRRQVTTHAAARTTRSTGWVPFALVAVVVVPAIAGSLRLVELAGGPHVLPANPRMTASPLPVVIHIICAVLYAVLGAFQFSSGFRRRRPGWHRAAGRVVVALGLAVAFSALWMTLFYPRQPGTGELAYLFRLAFGSGMAASIILGFTTIRHGDIARHRAWMTRAYALALGAGTQVFTLGIGKAVFGTSELTTDLSLAAGWAINLAVAEYIIRRHGSRRSISHRTINATTKVGSS